jgi:hypothetical protein
VLENPIIITPPVSCDTDDDCEEGACISGECVVTPGECQTSDDCNESESCEEVEYDDGTSAKECVVLGILGCEGYDNLDDCDNYDWWAPEYSISQLKGDGFCDDKNCYCAWDETLLTCGAGYEELDALGEPTGTGCSYSASQEGECQEGIRTITYNSEPECLEGGTEEVQIPCFVATEVPFFGVFNLLISAGLVVVFYVVGKKVYK